MTDVPDAPPARSPERQTAASPPAAPVPTGEPTAASWLLAGLLAGAGAIHLAMAPSHLGESAIEGGGFLAAGWAQLALAVALVLRITRGRLLAVAGTGVALVATWAMSRTAGLPFGAHGGHAESVSVVDGTCVALEAAAIVLAVALLVRGAVPRATAPAPQPPAGTTRQVAPRGRGLAMVGGIAAVAVATGALSSPEARDHAAASHGDHAAGHEAAAGEHDHGAVPAGVDPGFAALSNGHQHESGNDEPLTTEARVALSRQLAATADLVEKFPTIADAEAAGWTRSGPFSPGLGTHYSPPSFIANGDGDMDAEDLAAPMLVYDGLEPDAPLAGFMYLAYGTEAAPEGFAGPNDHWHYHESVCIVVREDGTIDTPFGADLEGVTEDMCTDVGGAWITNTGYMVHVWNVPGYESPDGMFTELNPAITCPDGTYDRIDIADVGTKDSVCLNP